MKKVIIAIIILVFVVIATVLALNTFVKEKITSFLTTGLADDMTLSYDDVNVDTWSGTVSLENTHLTIKRPGDSLAHTTVTTELIKIEDLSYWGFLFQDRVHVARLVVENNKVRYRMIKKETPSNELLQPPLKLNKAILIDNLTISNTSFTMSDGATDSLILDLRRGSLQVLDIRTDAKIIKQKLPLTYKKIDLYADSLFLNLNRYDALSIGKIRMNESNLHLAHLNLKTKYSTTQLSKMIATERDYIDLTIDSLKIKAVDWGFKNSKLRVQVGLVSMEQPRLQMYRDKLVADDLKPKPLYSKMLRDIPFDFMMDSLHIDNATITYNEKVKIDQPAGRITFDKLNLQASKIGNTYSLGSTATKIYAQALFLDTAPIDINWDFDVQDPEDQFHFDGSVGRMAAHNINSFTEPNLRAKMTGTVNRVYFTINGDKNSSAIDMKMNYDDFEVEILKKDSSRNWVVSKLANLFVPKDSKQKNNDNYREGTGKAIRDDTKSYFNYLWLNLKAGLIKTMISRQKQDKK